MVVFGRGQVSGKGANVRLCGRRTAQRRGYADIRAI